MSKSQLQIVFDRADRSYHFGERVSGKVILNSMDNFTCRKVWMDYGWRTHGKGNKDQGERKILMLQGEETHFSRGEHKVYLFELTAPNGPMTYHGVHINVDWYIAVHIDIPLAPDINDEEDILLLPSESPPDIILGDTNLSPIQSPTRRRVTQTAIPISSGSQLSKRSRDPFSEKPRTLFILALISTLAIGALLVFLQLDCLLSLIIFIIAGVLIYGGMIFITNAIAKQKLDIQEIRIEPSEVYLGEQLGIHMQFQTKGAIYLDSIAALLTAEEEAVSGGGTNVTTNRHTAYKYSFEKPYSENLLAGRWVSFDCLLPISPSAPATFIASSNRINWSIKINIRFKRWPSWGKTIPITVLPA